MRGSIAEQLAAVLRYTQEPDHDPEPLKTNWAMQPSENLNPEDLTDLTVERHWDISPSVDEIMRQVALGPIVKNEASQVVRIGTLRFSDGTQTELAHKRTADGQVIQRRVTMPAGAMLGTVDKERAERGGEDYYEVKLSNDYFGAEKTVEDQVGGLFNARRPGKVKPVRRRERTGPKTKAEERQWLADAIANTPVMPEVTKLPDGFPAGPEKLADLFPGLVKPATGSGGSQAWEDIVTERENREDWFRWVDSLKDEDRAALEAVKTAKTLAEVGGDGVHRRTAERRGRRKLIAANDNLMAFIKKIAS